jgi:hypothetical protein
VAREAEWLAGSLRTLWVHAAGAAAGGAGAVGVSLLLGRTATWTDGSAGALALCGLYARRAGGRRLVPFLRAAPAFATILSLRGAFYVLVEGTPDHAVLLLGGPVGWLLGRAPPPRPAAAPEPDPARLDRILALVAREGRGAVSKADREFLARASRRARRRGDAREGREAQD